MEKETYFRKTVGDNVVGFQSRINQHISDCRTGTSTCKFAIHVYHCAMKNKCVKEPYFQLNIMMILLTVKEYLKKHLNLLSWVYLVNTTNLFFAAEKLHSKE